jgi:RNA polymerase sigma-70 factor (ECF subfamily)
LARPPLRLHLPANQPTFEATVLPHLDAAYSFARYLVRNDADAQDAVQDACVRALTYFAGFRGEDARSWLLRIVRNVCNDQWRRRRSQAMEPLDEGASSGESPEDGLLRSAMRPALRAAVDALPTEYREVIVLREIEELSYAEIAAVVEVPIGTVMSRLSRGRARLQQALDPTASGGVR